jgi:hypothetical protein
MSLQNTSDIITAFELYFGDETSLSSQEELDLLQKKYDELLSSTEWEFLKKEATGSISNTEITQPSDFDRLTSDQRIYIGSNFKEYPVIPFTDRRNYRNMNGYFYYDAKNEKFVSTFSINSTYSFDYIYVPPALDKTGSNPVFPLRFYSALFHAMCIDADIINMSDKARSYASLNQRMYDEIVNNMKSWNIKISGFNTYGV